MLVKRVLIVEDEPAIADNIVFALEAEGFATTVCHTGREALDTFLDSEIVFIVLDIGLPDLSGIEVCKQVRAKSNVPLTFLTAKSDEIDRILGLELGADYYITKPFSPRELTARILTILRMVDTKAEARVRDTSRPLHIDDNRRMFHFKSCIKFSSHCIKVWCSN